MERNLADRSAVAAPRTFAPIVKVVTHVVTRNMSQALWNPRTLWSSKKAVLVGVQDESGMWGVGECYCDGGSTESVVAIVQNDFAPLVMGATAGEIGRLGRDVKRGMVVASRGGAAHAAWSGVDIALWDLLGKTLRTPVSSLLGGTASGAYAYASAGLYGKSKTTADLQDEMTGYVAQGFTGVKLKVGGLSVTEDLARVRAVREAVGPSVRLMVDALYALTVADALKMARGLAPLDVHFFEAPVHPDNIAGLAEVRASRQVPVAGNEFAYGLPQFLALMQARAVDVVHLDAILCGGISEAMRIAALAEAFHLPVSMHAASSVVCLAANLHVAAAIPNNDSCEFHMIHRMFLDHCPPGHFWMDGAQLQLPSAPGLGLPFADPRELPAELAS